MPKQRNNMKQSEMPATKHNTGQGVSTEWIQHNATACRSLLKKHETIHSLLKQLDEIKISPKYKAFTLA
jgi:hypothetical protein